MSGVIRAPTKTIERSDARTRLILDHRGLVRNIAKMVGRRIPRSADVMLDDLCQEGMIGLIQAADRFDATKGKKFTSYAGTRINGAILDYLRRLDHIPRRVRQAGNESRLVSIEGEGMDFASGMPSPLTLLMAKEMRAHGNIL